MSDPRLPLLERLLLPTLLCLSCGPAPLTVEMPLHLEDHVAAATITGSELPANPPPSVEWRFDQPQPEWKATPKWHTAVGPATLARTGVGLRVSLTHPNRLPNGTLEMAAGIHVDLPDWDRGEWADVVIRARIDSASSVRGVGLRFNLREGRPTTNEFQSPYQFRGQNSPIVADGSIHTYRLRVSHGAAAFKGPWRQLGLWFLTAGGKPGNIELLSVSVTPASATYADSAQGVRPITVGERIRRTLYTHAPSSHAYGIRIPAQARLDLALGILSAGAPVTFAVTARNPNGRVEILLEERHTDPEQWVQRSVDLAKFAGRTMTLTLTATSEQAGAVAFWGAPTVSGRRASGRPNVILYVIDGGGADYMSLYGYSRRTTPHLERFAAEGVVFEQAYSNSSWTKPSTASFMTSLHNTVLGFTGGDFDPLPDEALTMAQRLHAAGYQTAVFTSNPNAGTSSGLQRGADLLLESEFQHDATSSKELHQAFWNWRATHPGQPYWAHFQTTDVHALGFGGALDPGVPVSPFAGLFLPPAQADTLRAWSLRVQEGGGRNGAAFALGGLSKAVYLTMLQGMYDEQMAHNDYHWGRLIDRLKASGEWPNTLLIVTADHSLDGFFGTDMTERLDPVPPRWTWSTLRATVSRIPFVIVWPSQIAAGRRFTNAVSLIDLLPTVLDLVGLPPPEVMQGQSLAPLLRGQRGWTPRPIIMDETVTFGGEDRNTISVIDGRWGATKKFGPPLRSPDYSVQPWPVLLFDLWSDPMAVAPVNAAYPDLVRKYTALLDDTRRDHETLAKVFTPGAGIALTPGQLERLRALGYIR